MQFDPDNPIIKRCSKGMEMEGLGKPEEAKKLFCQAWEEASTDMEKFTAAHYVARHQNSIKEKLDWDILSLQWAMKTESDEMKAHYPSLYLNIAKGYEELNQQEKAMENYTLALDHIQFLPDNGYGKMIIGGIKNGIKRINPDA